MKKKMVLLLIALNLLLVGCGNIPYEFVDAGKMYSRVGENTVDIDEIMDEFSREMEIVQDEMLQSIGVIKDGYDLLWSFQDGTFDYFTEIQYRLGILKLNNMFPNDYKMEYENQTMFEDGGPVQISGIVTSSEFDDIDGATVLIIEDEHDNEHVILTMIPYTDFKYGDIISVYGEIRTFFDDGSMLIASKYVYNYNKDIVYDYTLTNEEKTFHFGEYMMYRNTPIYNKQTGEYEPSLSRFYMDVYENNISGIDITINETRKVGDIIYISFRFNNTNYGKSGVYDLLSLGPDGTIKLITHYQSTNNTWIKETPVPKEIDGFKVELWGN